MFIPINFLPSYALSRGMSLPLSNYIVSIFNGASIIGRLLTGYYGDKIGVFNMVVMITALTGVVVLALWVPAQHNAMIYVFSVMYGASTGAFISISPAIMAHISDIREIGLRNGAEYMVISFAALAGSPIGGALLTATGGYLAMQLFAGVALFVGCAGFVCVRWRLAGWKVLEKV